MFNFYNLPIEKKLRYAMLATVEIVLIMTLIIYSAIDYSKSKEALVSQLESITYVIGSSTKESVKERNSKHISKILNSLLLIPSVQQAYITDKEGNILSSLVQKKKGSRNLLFTKIEKSSQIDVIGPIYYNQALVGKVRIRGDLSLLIEKVTINILLGSLIILIALLFSYVIASKFQKIIASPIIKLAKAMSDFSNKKTFDVQLIKESQDEIGDLYDNFNEMIQQIRDRDTILSRHKEELEQTVRQRTKELNSTNKSLKKAIYEANEAKEVALTAAKTKSTFLANMSHEIRTPMNGILGMLELVKHTSIDETQLDYINTATNSANALLTIINDILDFSKIEAGKIELEKIDIAPCLIAEEVVSLLAEKAREKDIELVCFVDTDIPYKVKGDSVRLRQILLNLLGNAIKFTEKGEIVLKLTLQDKNDAMLGIKFEVIDSGIGIPKEALSKLFEPFTQTDGSITRKYGGTGLGLTISYQLVSIMGGTLSVNSVVNEGSNFYFTVYFEASNAASEDNIPEISALRGRRALIVDDCKTSREAIDNYLSALAMECTQAGNGKEALDILSKAVLFDVLYIDIRMPEMGGIELSKMLRDKKLFDTIPKVLLTISSDGTDQQEIASSLFDATFLKPIRRQALVKLTSSLLVSDERKSTMNFQPTAKDNMDQIALFDRDLKILLVEDNIVNQKVALAMLKKLGLSAEVVENGLQAVEVIKEKHFDLVFMDCQMPVMSGYEASRQIRSMEKNLGDVKYRLPIIAMTANAMEGDREKCLSAGMDDYITKPINIERLSQMLKKWTLDKQLMEENIMSDTDYSAILEQVNDRELLNSETFLQLKNIMEDAFESLAVSYLDDSMNLIQDIHDAIVNSDVEVFTRAAHTLKSSSLNMGAEQLGALAEYLEAQGKTGNLQGLESLVQSTKTIFQKTETTIKSRM